MRPPLMAEIIGPDGRIHCRRPIDHIDVTEALVTPGYRVELVEASVFERKSDGSGGIRAADLHQLHNLPPKAQEPR
jgi:hypothetical protein